MTYLMGNGPTLPALVHLTWQPLILCVYMYRDPTAKLGGHQYIFWFCTSGLFEPVDTKFDIQRDPLMDPSLKDMTEAAVKVLSRNPKGFYLFVEGESPSSHGKRGQWTGTGSSSLASCRGPNRPWSPSGHSLSGAD